MKKITALLLTLVMIFSMCAIGASAASVNKHEKCPVIFIAGSSVDLVDENQNPISTGFDVFTDDDEGDMTKEEVIQKVMNVLVPFIMEGLPFDKWDNYGKALYTELAPIFDEGRLDGDGNPKYGTGISDAERTYWEKVAATEDRGKDGKFSLREYDFRYDWRLSPYDTIERLDEYIDAILETTKCEKVCLVGRCLGGNIITAYLDKYGSEGKVAKVVYDETMANGSSTVNDCFSGKIKFSDKHIQAFLLETEHFGKENIGIDIADMSNLLLEIIERTLDLTTQVGILETVFGSVELLYERLYEALMPAFLLASGMATWPSYWTSVYEEDFDAALNLMFGEEGSEYRTEFAGLIEKIEYLRERITIPREKQGEENLYKKFEKDYGVEIGIIVGYGLLQAPITESYDLNGDCTVDLNSASFGATSAGVFDTLPQEYIDERIAAGYGDYISPDGKVDASTCLFPETTWFIKNKHHDTWRSMATIAEYFTQYSNVNANSNSKNIQRFLVIDPNGDIEKAVNMTADNCQDGPWLDIVEQEPTKETKIASLIRFLTTLLKLFVQLLNGTFELGL